jgi:hypothetical protein
MILARTKIHSSQDTTADPFFLVLVKNNRSSPSIIPVIISIKHAEFTFSLSMTV